MNASKRVALADLAHAAPLQSTHGAPAVKTILVLHKLLMAAALSLCAAQASAADPASPQLPAVHPITGKWTWTLPGTKCGETLQYRTDGTRSGSSGEEATEGAFQITLKPSLLGFYRLTETLTTANGKRDCAGDLHEVGADSPVRFIQFNPKMDLLIVCKTESLKACYGPLRRVTE